VFLDVREPHTNRLLFRYDPLRQLVEIQERKVKTVVDLTQYAAPKGHAELQNKDKAAHSE
jgi:hypothetical protein